MDEVFISAADDVVVGDSDGVDAAPAGLQDVNTLQRADVPDLINTQSRSETGGCGRKGFWVKKKKKKWGNTRMLEIRSIFGKDKGKYMFSNGEKKLQRRVVTIATESSPF